jgi:acetyl esterase/lipase
MGVARWAGSSLTLATYKIDAEKLVVSGISAGGHLALTTAVLSKDGFRECPASVFKIAAVINWFGPSNVLDLIEGPNPFDQAVEWIGDRGDRREVARAVSPFLFYSYGPSTGRHDPRRF